MDTIVRNHPLNPHVTGTQLSDYPFLVVELDIPWDDSQIPKYGPTFKPWSEEEIETALAAIKEAIPMNRISYVVSTAFSAKECESINDFIMYKIGTLLSFLLLVRRIS